MIGFQARAILLALCLLLSGSGAAHAGYIHEWTLQELAAQSEALVTAQVVSVETIGRVEPAPRDYPLLRRRATVRVVRAWAKGEQKAPEAEQEITLDFKSFDLANIGVMVNTSPGELPRMEVDQIWVFPLRRNTKNNENDAAADTEKESFPWRLLEGYGENLLTPADLREPPTTPDTGRLSGWNFLRSELAGVFVNGDEKQISSAIRRYFFGYGLGGSPLLAAFDLVEPNIQDEERWVSIGALGLLASATTTPRVPLEKLLDSPPQKSWSHWQRLQARIFSHVPRAEIEKRLLEAILRHMKTPHTSGATALVNDFGHEPEVRREMEAGLERNDRQWISAAGWMNGANHPLRDVALGWARRRVAGEAPLREVWEAIWILRGMGSAQDLDALVARIERARRAGAPDYKALLRLSSSNQIDPAANRSHRALAPRVWSRLLDDKTPWQNGMQDWRWCDQAAVEIGYGAKVNLNIRFGSTLQERNLAVNRARALTRATSGSGAKEQKALKRKL